MNIQNEAKISFISKSTNERFARTAISAFFSTLDPTIEDLNDIKTAVSEAVTNCIVHGYKEKIGTIYITLRIINDDIAYIKIRDNGCGIIDIKRAMQPLFTTEVSGERAGLGFSVMQSFMDSVRVFSTKCKSTTVVMTKRLELKKND